MLYDRCIACQGGELIDNIGVDRLSDTNTHVKRHINKGARHIYPHPEAHTHIHTKYYSWFCCLHCRGYSSVLDHSKCTEKRNNTTTDNSLENTLLQLGLRCRDSDNWGLEMYMGAAGCERTTPPAWWARYPRGRVHQNCYFLSTQTHKHTQTLIHTHTHTHTQSYTDTHTNQQKHTHTGTFSHTFSCTQ